MGPPATPSRSGAYARQDPSLAETSPGHLTACNPAAELSPPRPRYDSQTDSPSSLRRRCLPHGAPKLDVEAVAAGWGAAGTRRRGLPNGRTAVLTEVGGWTGRIAATRIGRLAIRPVSSDGSFPGPSPTPPPFSQTSSQPWAWKIPSIRSPSARNLDGAGGRTGWASSLRIGGCSPKREGEPNSPIRFKA